MLSRNYKYKVKAYKKTTALRLERKIYPYLIRLFAGSIRNLDSKTNRLKHSTREP
jgi:hypothetical protein